MNDDAAVRPNGAFSIDFWAKQDGTAPSVIPRLLVKGNSATANGHMTWHGGDGSLDFKRNNTDAVYSTGSLTSAYRHFVVTYNGTAVSWYVDSALSTTTPRTFPSDVGTDVLKLGRGDERGLHTLDEVTQYDRALSSSQISSHCAAGTAAAAPSATPAPTPTGTGSPSSASDPTIAAAGDIAFGW